MIGYCNILRILLSLQFFEKKKLEGRGAEAPRPPGFPSFLGGDPSAGSPTDTLLRLNPPCRRQARIPH